MFTPRKEGIDLPLDHTDLKELKKRGDIEGLLGILDTLRNAGMRYASLASSGTRKLSAP
jgi:hypothetical protein